MRSIGAMGVVTLLFAATLAGCGLQPENFDYYTVSGATRTMAPHPVSSPGEGIKFTFMPIVGAPTNSADELYRVIRSLMARDQLAIVNGLDEPTTYRVRIHLNAVATNTWTTLVYQVDIHDATGRRVHNFGGQFMTSAGTGDPWAGLSKSFVHEVAAQIEGGVYAWTTRRA